MNYCPECGYPNDSSEHRCERCGIRFDHPAGPAPWLGQSVSRASAATAANPLEYPVVPAATPPQPRIRSRKNLQPGLPFDSAQSSTQSATATVETVGKVIRFPGHYEDPAPVPAAPPAPPVPVATWGPPEPRRLPAIPPEPPPRPLQQAISFPPSYAEPQTLLEFPVADLESRWNAAMIDGMLMLAGCGLFLLCFGLWARWMPHRPVDPLATVFLLLAVAGIPVLYLYAFLVFAKATPGMQWNRLRLVNFDGRPATRHQRKMRVLASLASVASLAVGFLWAIVDDEKLTWHDRMSETCLTLE